MNGHEITVNVRDFDGPEVVLLCHEEPEAPCRCRPPDWEDREEWTFAEATQSGFPCWAVQYIAEGGLDQLRYDGPSDPPFAYAGPVEVWFDDAVAWKELGS